MSTPLTVAFTLSATEVNLLDTTPVTIINVGPVTKSIVRVPTRLEIWREAGTAYTVTKVPDFDTDGTAIDHDDLQNAGTKFPKVELVIRDADSRGYAGQVLFRIPMGFLENPLASGMVVLPESGLVLTGKKLTLTIQSLTAIADGTGSVKGILHFDEVYLPV